MNTLEKKGVLGNIPYPFTVRTAGVQVFWVAASRPALISQNASQLRRDGRCKREAAGMRLRAVASSARPAVRFRKQIRAPK